MLKTQLEGFLLTQSACQSKVNEFDFAASLIDTHDVLRFEIQVDNAFLMDEIYSIHNLKHVFDHLSLRQLKVLVYDPLKQLPSRYPEEHETAFSQYTRHIHIPYVLWYTDNLKQECNYP